MRHVLFAATLIALAAPSAASAKVLITEVQPSPKNQLYVAQWIELQNTGTTAASLDGWTLNNYVGTDPSAESTTRWAFPANTTLAPGQVIVVARQADAFRMIFSTRPQFELADGADDPTVPNLVPTGGTEFIQLSPARTGDAVVLRSPMGTYENGVEWGIVDRSVPGIPESEVPLSACQPASNCPLGQSLERVSDTGSSNADFIVTNMPTPGGGFTPSVGPMIAGTQTTPSNLGYADTLSVATSVSDQSGINFVNIHIATATAAAGRASQNYVTVAMTSTGGAHYGFAAMTGDLGAGLGFNDPMTFHDKFVRWYISAENGIGQDSTDPANASEVRTNGQYYWKNVMPTAPSPIVDVRNETAGFAATYAGLSATVQGVALTVPGLLSPSHFDVAIQDASGYAVRVYNTDALMADVKPGTLLEATGMIQQVHGVMRLGGDSSVKVVGMGSTTTSTFTIVQLLGSPEHYESELVYIKDVDFASAAASWPGGEMGGTVDVKDGTGTITLRISGAASDLLGKATPKYGFHLRGILSQNTPEASGTMGSYEIIPRGAGDILAKPAPSGPDGGTGGGGGDGSTGGNGGNGSGGDGGPNGGGGAAVGKSGCGCNTAGPVNGGSSLLGLLAAALLLLRRRAPAAQS